MPVPKVLLLNGETFAAAAGAGGIGISKLEPFAIESIAEVELSASQIEETLHIHDNLKFIIIENLIAGFDLGVKFHVIAQAAAASADYTHAQKCFRLMALFHFQVGQPQLSLVAHCN